MILLEDNILIGFISIFPNDGEERQDLSPWYATMYVKKDGNYNKTLRERLDNADLIIWLNYSSFAHLKGVLKRIIKNYNKEKSELPGCKERFNFTFLKYVLTYNRKKRPQVLQILDNVPSEKMLIFKKQKDLNNWLKKYTNNENILEKLV